MLQSPQSKLVQAVAVYVFYVIICIYMIYIFKYIIYVNKLYSLPKFSRLLSALYQLHSTSFIRAFGIGVETLHPIDLDMDKSRDYSDSL
jgi:hypothetical protein